MQNMENAHNNLVRGKCCLVFSAKQLHVIAVAGSLEVLEKPGLLLDNAVYC